MLNSTFGLSNIPASIYAGHDVLRSADFRALAESYIPDPHLPGLATDFEKKDWQIVINPGRFVGFGNCIPVNAGMMHRRGLGASNELTLTLSDGANIRPAGMVANRVIRNPNAPNVMQPGGMVSVFKQAVFGVPYRPAHNEATGTPRTGDKLTGHYGSTTSSSVAARNFNLCGKPVLWIRPRTLSVTAAAASTHVLAAAAYPGVQPEVVVALNASGAAVTGTYTYTYTSSGWQIGCPANVTTIIFTLGHGEDMIGGQVTDIVNLVRVKNRDVLLQYVEAADIDTPELQKNAPTSTVSQENPTAVVAGRVYRVANYPMSLNHPVIVEVQGTVVDPQGNSTTYASSDWYALPSVRDTQLGQFAGLYHTIDWQTGLITIAGNITVTAIRVTYSYITNWARHASLWGAGIRGLTDGSNLTAGETAGGVTVVPANPRGIPAVFNESGVTGELRFWVD